MLSVVSEEELHILDFDGVTVTILFRSLFPFVSAFCHFSG